MEDTLVTDAFNIPSSYKERLERLAKEQDPYRPNKSKLLRDILAEYFERLDSKKAKQESAPRKHQPQAA